MLVILSCTCFFRAVVDFLYYRPRPSVVVILLPLPDPFGLHITLPQHSLTVVWFLPLFLTFCFLVFYCRPEAQLNL